MLKNTREYHYYHAKMQFYHSARGAVPLPPANYLGTLISLKSRLCAYFAQRCARGRPITLQIDFFRKSADCGSDLLFTIYSPLGCPENVHFFIPEGTKNACGARAATFALHRRHFWALFDQKMARVGSSRRPNAAQGLQNTS